MNWENVIGQKNAKEQLKKSISDRRISHAQIFSGKTGWGSFSLAMAYISAILASEKGEKAIKKVETLQHPDIHFSIPVASTDSIKKPHSNLFFKEFREFILENPFGSSFDWLEFYGIEKKQGIINVLESEEILRFLSLNSYEGSYKFCVIWYPETMNLEAANKILKILEEPPAKTVFLLLAEREDLLLPTIYSRCQLVKLNPLSVDEISGYLENEKGLDKKQAYKIAAMSDGDMNLALKNINAGNNEFENYFVSWVRNAFMAAKNPRVLKNLVRWSQEISVWPREKQKQFLIYCSEIFRQAILRSYRAESLVYMSPEADGFNWEKFTPFIHGANIESILEELSESSYHIERNANGKIVFLDLSIKLTRYLHRKPK